MNVDVADAHAWLWWLNDRTQLGSEAERAIESAKDDRVLAVSAMSAWEAAMLVKKGRLELRLSATQLGAALVTKDQRIHASALVPTI